MKCNNCGADIINTKVCLYCGTEYKDVKVLAVQIMKTYTITARGFMANGIAKIKLKSNDVVKNDRTNKSFNILYVTNNKFKIVKNTEPEQECTLCLLGAQSGDFEPGDNLII